MIHFFTDPYKDTLEELFGKKSIIPSLHIGSNFKALAENIGPKYSPNKLIEENTILPYYMPYM